MYSCKASRPHQKVLVLKYTIHPRYNQEEISQAGNSTDLFIDGRGLFALQHGDERYYTRAGMMRFNRRKYPSRQTKWI